MGAPAPWEADPVVNAAPAASPAPSDAPWSVDPPVQAADAPQAQSVPDAAPEGSGFNDEQQRAIRDFLPKAKDAADLERFSLELSGGKSKIGNAQEILDKMKNGATPEAFAFAPPKIDKSLGQSQPLTMDHVRTTVRDALMNLIAPGLGPALGQSVEASAKPYIEHTANSLAMDYGPEVGGVIDTILHGGDVSNNAAHERAIMSGDSQDHPVASIMGELTGAGLDGALGNEAGLANAPRAARIAAGLGEGAAYGSGAAGPGNRAEGAVVGGALGTGTEAAAPIIQRFIAATKSGDTAAAAEAAQAAHELGIDLPKFVAAGPEAAQKASALEQTVAGSGPIRAATNKLLDQSEAARDTIASSLGAAAEPVAMGDQALNAAVSQNKAARAAGGALYRQAETATAGTTIAPTQTLSTIDNLLADEQSKLVPSKIAPVLQGIRDRIASAGQITVQQARDLRTSLRESLSADADATPDNAERITKAIMGGVNTDMETGLKAAGKEDAFNLYAKADANWAAHRQLEDEVLKPFLGKNFDNWGEDVAKAINSNAKGNGTRLARFLSALPEDEANNVRASIISRLGRSSDGAQNAAGDAFSLDQFLTNWNQVKGARNMIFPKETVQSLDKLAQVAEAAKAAGRTKNRSNTGGVISYLKGGAFSLPTVIGGAETLLAHDPRGLALGMLASAIRPLGQYRAARLLASPAFAKKLAATPLNEAGAKAFWSRPWVNAMAAKNPAIAAEIQAFQHAFLTGANDNALTSAAAQPQGDNQNQ